ncbi:MAG: putative lipase [Myxococcaceae bacterium]|nr:putative lipase [Myxococcaceae bacterium]
MGTGSDSFPIPCAVEPAVSRTLLLQNAPAILLFAALAQACGDDGKSDEVGGVTVAPLVCGDIVSDSACDKTLRPIVFIHGTLGAGDNGEHVAMLFGSNGYCQERFVAVDYNSLGGDPSTQVDALIAKVLADTGQTKVDVMGHSQGGDWGYKYVSDATRAAKVANYVHLAGGNQAKPPPGVRTLSITSKADQIAGVNSITGSEKVVTLETADHMGVAESTESFVEMYKFLLGKDPKYTEVQCGDEEVTVAGKAASLGDNTPAAGSTVEFYELGKDPIKRGTPAFSGVVAADGSIGPNKLKRGVAYESRIIGPDGVVAGHMYYTPWKRSDYLTRGLIPAKTGLSSTITNQIPKDDNSSVIVVRYNQSAIRADLGHTLTFDGKNVLLAADATPSSCTVAYFTWDDNKNGATDLTDVAGLSIIPFVKAVDVFTQATKPKYVDVTFNNVTVKVPNWPSSTQGPSVVMFQ